VDSSCGTRPILRARGAVVADDVVAVGQHRPKAGADDAADDADQGGLAGAVGAEQGEDLAAADVQSCWTRLSAWNLLVGRPGGRYPLETRSPA
jgi:hypothetical protein